MRLHVPDPRTLLPMWLLVSVLINGVLVAAAGAGLARHETHSGTATHMVLQARVVKAIEAAVPIEQAAPETIQPPVRTMSRARTSRAAAGTTARPRHASSPSQQAVADEDAWRDSTGDSATLSPDPARSLEHAAAYPPQDLPGRNEYTAVPNGDPVQVVADRHGDRLGGGVPGAGKAGAGDSSGHAAGGGAGVLTGGRSGTSFSVGGIPGSHGYGPGLGGTGAGIGVGGRGSGVGLAGCGRGAGIGGQGGTAPLPKRIAVSATGRRGVPRSIEASDTAAAIHRGSAEKGCGTGVSLSETSPAPKAEPLKPQPVGKPEPQEPTKADLSRFRSMVQSRVASAKTYPAEARSSGQSGSVKVSFSVGSSGAPSGVSVASSSGFSSLDSAAVRAVKSAAPFLPFPKHAKGNIRVNVTVNFRLN